MAKTKNKKQKKNKNLELKKKDITLKEEEIYWLRISAFVAASMAFFTLAAVGANIYLIYENQKLIEANRLMANSSVELTKLQIDTLKPKFEVKSKLLRLDNDYSPPSVWSQISDFDEGEVYTLFIRYGELYNNTIILNFFNTGHVPIAINRVRLVDDCSGKIIRDTDSPVKILSSGESYTNAHDFVINGSYFIEKDYCHISYLLDGNDFKKEYLIKFIDYGIFNSGKLTEKVYDTCRILCEEEAQKIIIWDKKRVTIIPSVEGIISKDKITVETYKVLRQEEK